MKWIAVIVATAVAVAVATAPFVASFVWQVPLIYVGLAFLLGVFVRLKNPAVEQFVQVFVLSGSAPIVIRAFFGPDLDVAGTVHIAALLAAAVGVGIVLAERVRPRNPIQATA